MKDRNNPENWLEHYPHMGSLPAGIRRKLEQVNLGNRAVIQPTPGPPLDAYVAPTGLTPYPTLKPRILYKQRILTVSADLLQEYAYAPGSWVLTVRGRPLTLDPSAAYPGNYRIAPLVAEVVMGSGGASHVAEIDAASSQVSIPTTDITVDVGVSQVIGDTVFGETVGLFASYEVFATIHKTTASGLNKPTRSFLNFRQGEVSYAIPDFSEEWCVVPMNELAYGDPMFGVPVYFFPNTFVGNPFLPASGAAVQIETVSVDIASQMGRTHCFRPLHPNAQAMFTNNVGIDPTPSYPNTAIFRLGF